MLRLIYSLLFLGLIPLAQAELDSSDRSHLEKCFSKNLHLKEYKTLPLKYAKLLSIYENLKTKSFLVKAHKLTDQSQSAFWYLIGPSKFEVKADCQNIWSITRSLNSVALTSTTHLAMFKELGLYTKIKAMANLNLVYDPHFNQKFKKSVVQLKYPLSVEKIVKIKIDLLIDFAVENKDFYLKKKLGQFRVPIFFMGEYLETHPLARLEWIKVIGILFRQFNRSQQYFTQIESQYLALKEKIGRLKLRPKKFLFGKDWKVGWQAPGRKSGFYQVLKDSGANYLLDTSTDERTQTLSWEKVVQLDQNSEVWLAHSFWEDRASILKENKKYRLINAFRSGKIFNNNKRSNSQAGNDFWESGSVHPERVLLDLAKIFYPQTFGRDYFYYQELL